MYDACGCMGIVAFNACLYYISMSLILETTLTCIFSVGVLIREFCFSQNEMK